VSAVIDAEAVRRTRQPALTCRVAELVAELDRILDVPRVEPSPSER